MNTILLPSLIVIEKLVGFIKQIFISSYLGTTNLSDAYNLSESIISIIRTSISLAVPTITLATYVVKSHKKKDRDLAYFNNVFSFGFFATAAITLVILVICMLLYFFFSSTEIFSSDVFLYALILAPTILLAYTANMLGVCLEADSIFLPTKMVGLYNSLSIVIFIYFFYSRVGILSIFFAEVFAFLLNVIIIRIILFKKKIRVALHRSRYTTEVKANLSASIPLMFSYSLNSINNFVNKIIAINLVVGASMALQCAYLITIELFPSIIILAFNAVIVKKMSLLVADSDTKGLDAAVGKYITGMAYFLVFIVAVLMCHSTKIVSIVFERGSFSEMSVQMTSMATIGYAIALPFYPIREVLIRLHYTFHDTKTPLKNSALSIAFNILFSIILSKLFGLLGIALAASISLIASCILNCITIKKHAMIRLSNTTKEYAKLFAAGIVSFAAGMLGKNVFHSEFYFFEVVVSSMTMLVVYLSTTVLFHSSVVKETVATISIQKHKGNK